MDKGITESVLNFAIENLADGETYTTTDIYQLAQASDDPIHQSWSTQIIGDRLRSWARRNAIYKGHCCREIQQAGQRTRYEVWAKGKRGVVTSDVQNKLVVESSPLKTDPKPKTSGGGTFRGKVLDQKDDGSMLIRTPDDKLYRVQPIDW